MSKTKIILLLMIILLLLSEHSPCAVDPYYTSCRPFQCGNLNITFPFYVDQHQPSYCGTIGNQYYPLKITCKNKHQPFINLSGDSYLITNISYKQQIFHIINSALILNPKSSCPTSSIHNLTSTNSGKFLNYLDMMANTSEILLLQNCTNDVYNRIVSSRRDLLNCRNSRSSNKVSFTVYATDLKQGTDLINSTCGGVISVRYDDAASSSSATTRSIADDLRRGINLKWIANNCTSCEESGGSCGYTNTFEFKCFCPDRPHSGSCKIMDDPAGHNNSRKKSSSKKLSVIVAVPIIVGVFLLVSAICLIACRRRRLKHASYEDDSLIDSAESLHFDLTQIRIATHNFSEDKKLGQGGFGAVYKGRLENGEEIAVKRLSKNSGQGIAEFKTEVVLVARLQHRNLVKLLGFCASGKEKILVYEYLQNSSLDRFLFGVSGEAAKPACLNWKTRFKIICGIAKGLLYLHEDSRMKIIHRDLKSSNILLDNEMNPKIADFGLARLLGVDQTQYNTNRIVGTYGYMAPEYALTGRFSTKSDVYSFGVIVLEIVSGQKNRFFDQPEAEEPLIFRAWKLWEEKCAFQLVDPSLGKDYSSEEVMRCIHISLLCIQEGASRRPIMPSVVASLHGQSISLPIPAPPCFFSHSTMTSDLTDSRNTAAAHKPGESSISTTYCSITEFYPR